MIDLHMHSAYSDDGEFSATQLVEMCAAQGVSTLSISDHNSARANQEGRLAAERLGLNYINGIEIDCTFAGRNFHVLGYGIDDTHQDFSDIEDRVVKQSRGASLEMLKKTQELGFDVTAEDMKKLERSEEWAGRWTGEMFGELLLAMPEYTDHALLKPYREGGSRSDNPFVNFYWDFYSQGKPCHIPVVYPNMKDVISIIHHHGGKAVLAHPEANVKGDNELFYKLMDLELDGVEAFSTYHNPEQCAYYYDEAKRYGKFATCGSDFHGKTKPSIKLGGIPFPETFKRMEIEGELLKNLG